MKPKYIKQRSLLMIITVCSVILNCFQTFAQQDSLKVTYTEETSNYLLKQKYHYFDINLKNETNLLKAGALASIVCYKTLGQISFEHKLNPFMSVLFKTAYGSYDNGEDSIHLFPNEFGSVSIESRLYPRARRRIQNGISGNNLNGYYCCFEIGKVISREKNYDAFMQVGWGLQRRLNNYSYIDISLRSSILIRKGNVSSDDTINIEFGFGKSSKKK